MYATVSFFHEPQKIHHLLSANLPGLVHDHDSALRQSATQNEFGDRLDIVKPVAIEIDYLLPLRGDRFGDMSGEPQRFLDATQHETLPGACSAAEKCHEVCRS